MRLPDLCPPRTLRRPLPLRRPAFLPLLGALLVLAAGCSGKKLGDECDASKEKDCGDEMACTVGADFAKAVCTDTCSSNDDCQDEGHCVSLSTGSFCLPECEKDEDCGEGSQCSAPTLSTSAFKVCLSKSRAFAASSANCPAPALVTGGVVGPPAEPPQCRRTPQASSLPAARAIPLGTFGVNQAIPFDIPAGTQGFNLVVQMVDGTVDVTQDGEPFPNYVVPLTMIDPGGTTVYDFGADDPADVSTVPLLFNSFAPITMTIGVPNTSAALASVEKDNGVKPGKWQLIVYDVAADCPSDSSCVNNSGAGPSSYSVTLLLQPKAPDPGALDLGVYFATQETITAATAPSNPSIARMISTWASFYSAAGVCLRTVTFYDLPAWARAKYATEINVDDSSACSDFNQMFTLSQPGNTINIFLVDALKSASNGETVVAGTDGTIPGPSSVGGTPQSGAAVTMAGLFTGQCAGAPNLKTCGADFVAYIAAHEAGHWLGLYHTSERTGATFDGLVDSSACRCQSCVSVERTRDCTTGRAAGSTAVLSTDCNKSTVLCGGAENLMFWLLDEDISAGKLTAEQGKVMRSNPVVQAP